MSVREAFVRNETAAVVIVGGGVIGLTIARALAQRGVRDVTVVERNQFGVEASSAAGGMLAPQVEADAPDEFFRLACASRDMYPDFAEGLREETGIDVELEQSGTLYLGFTPEDEARLRHRYEWQTRAGLSVEWLPTDDARRVEPCVSPGARCALRFPNDVQVENRRLVRALVVANEALGVRLVTSCDVSAIQIEHERILGVETSLGHVRCASLVLAAGAWTSLIASPNESLTEVRVEPVRGQMLCFEGRSRIANHVIYSSTGYIVPRRDGRVLAGSTSERVGFDKSVTASGLQSIVATALEIAPGFSGLRLIDSWAGFRPRAQDDLPVLGPFEEVEGLCYATGHYRNGILLAPITGELVADAIVNATGPPLLTPFSPNRFRLAATASR
jgi:glycine oxidase